MTNSTLIYNPTAGGNPRRRERQIREVAATLERSGIAVTLAATSGPGTARELARQVSGRPGHLVLVCGGDGTINEVINGLLPANPFEFPSGNRVTLAILPGGTANVLAKELALPHNPVRAARRLRQWTPRKIALGKATWITASGKQPAEPRERFFLSVAGIGFDAYLVRKLSRASVMKLGVWAYVREACHQVFRYSFPRFTCRINGRDEEATFGLVQRSLRYAGWLRTAPRSSLLAPLFSVCLFKGSRPWRYFLYGAAIAALLHTRLSDVTTFECQKVTFTPQGAQKPVYFELDGELEGELPATFEIVPDALTLLGPWSEL